MHIWTLSFNSEFTSPSPSFFSVTPLPYRYQRHDRLGFYLGWGSFAWLPIMYCLQGWYVAMRDPALLPLSHLETAVIIAVFATGIVLFRLSNNQKDEFRADPNAKIWGKKPEFIEVWPREVN